MLCQTIDCFSVNVYIRMAFDRRREGIIKKRMLVLSTTGKTKIGETTEKPRLPPSSSNLFSAFWILWVGIRGATNHD